MRPFGSSAETPNVSPLPSGPFSVVPHGHVYALRQIAQLADVAGEITIRSRISQPVRQPGQARELVRPHHLRDERLELIPACRVLSPVLARFDFYASAAFNVANVRSSVRSKCSGVTDTRPDATTAVSLSAAFSRGPRWKRSQ